MSKRTMSPRRYRTKFLKQFEKYTEGKFGNRQDVTFKEVDDALGVVGDQLKRRHHIDDETFTSLQLYIADIFNEALRPTS